MLVYLARWSSSRIDHISSPDNGPPEVGDGIRERICFRSIQTAHLSYLDATRHEKWIRSSRLYIFDVPGDFAEDQSATRWDSKDELEMRFSIKTNFSSPPPELNWMVGFPKRCSLNDSRMGEGLAWRKS